jgi:hypothetical protein
MEWILILQSIIPALLVAMALVFTIRAFIKGTLWSNTISSALGGAVIGVLIVIIITLYLFFTIKKGETLFLVMWAALIGIPLFGIIGAIIFIFIGKAKRKNAPISMHKSSLIGPVSIDSESLEISSNGNFKPLFVKVVTVLVVINLLYAFLTLLGVVGLYPVNVVGFLVFPTLNMGLMYAIFYSIITASIVSEIVFLHLFFNLKLSSLKWLYSSIGFEIVIAVLNFQIIGLVTTTVVSWLVWDYISHKIVAGHRIFN